MYITELILTLKIDASEYDRREELIREYIHEKLCQGFQRTTAGDDPYKIPRLSFDANYNAYYCNLKFYKQ